MNQIYEKRAGEDVWYPLQQRKPKDDVTGELRIRVSFSKEDPKIETNPKKILKKPHVHNNVGKRKSVAPPPKKQIVPSGKKHKFQKENFKHPTYCAICETYIWGLSKAGYHCTDCTFDAHRKCIAQAKKLYCDVSIMQRSTVYIKDADVKNTRWKSSTFTVWLSYGSKTSVFLNPMATLESVLERICQMRSMEFEEHIAEDINGRPLEKNTLLGDIPQGEITFTKKDLTMNFLRRRGQVSRNPIENIKKNDEDTRLVKSLEQKVHIKETLEDEGMSENFLRQLKKEMKNLRS